jgi:AcrR family transcriptional regulator
MPTIEAQTAKHERRRAPRLPAEERRKQILDAAVEVFARLGFASAGTADIARAAGIGEPTIYRYFANKRDLYMAAVQRGSDEIIEHWTRIADEAPDGLAALQQIGVWYYQRMHTHPELLMLRSRSISEPTEGDVADVVRDAYRDVQQFVYGQFERARDEGMLAEDADIKTMTWLFMAVGSLLDQSQLLGLDELTPADIIKLSALIQPSR